MRRLSLINARGSGALSLSYTHILTDCIVFPHVSSTMERLAKRIARAGVCSRRAAEELIKVLFITFPQRSFRIHNRQGSCKNDSTQSFTSSQKGRVKVNGETVLELSRQVTPKDTIEIDGKKVQHEATSLKLLSIPFSPH